MRNERKEKWYDMLLRSKSLMVLLLMVSSAHACFSQSDTLRVLFLGNSYTAVNDLPGMVEQVAAGKGKTLIHASNTPGGYSFDQHAQNATSLDLIHQGNWDYVVMQEQSQIPVIPFFYDNNFIPGGSALADSIRAYNPCAQLVLYLTWGRRYGGMQCDQSGTYCSEDFVDFGHMQDSLTASYLRLSNIIEAKVAPCGEAWRHILDETEEVLHAGDNSHPNFSGSYVAACTMFATFWKEASEGTTYIGALDATVASSFQQAADGEVLNQPDLYHLNAEIPTGSINPMINQNEVTFEHDVDAFGSISYSWDFGDGNHSTDAEPVHVYGLGQYTAILTASQCGNDASFETEVLITSVLVEDHVSSPFVIQKMNQDGLYRMTGQGISNDDGWYLFSSSGKMLPTKWSCVSSGEAILSLPSDLPHGIYMIEWKPKNDHESHVLKFYH